jgi:NAD-dependent DNA ligase
MKLNFSFSTTVSQSILNELPDILISNQTNNEKINAVISVKGMALKTAESLVNNIADFKQFLTNCGLEYKLYEKSTETTANKEHPLFEKTIVLTGTRDKNIIEFLKNTGVKQGSIVNKNTYLVIAKNKDEDTGKAEDARKLNIPIMSVEDFTKTYIK